MVLPRRWYFTSNKGDQLKPSRSYLAQLETFVALQQPRRTNVIQNGGLQKRSPNRADRDGSIVVEFR